MALDYSQKRLLGKSLSGRPRTRRAKHLQVYAALTGFLSTLVSLASLIVQVLKHR